VHALAEDVDVQHVRHGVMIGTARAWSATMSSTIRPGSCARR
jgi:hypothetical protein